MWNGARSSSIGEEEPGAVDAVCTLTRWSEGAGEKQAGLLAGALGAVRQTARSSFRMPVFASMRPT